MMVAVAMGWLLYVGSFTLEPPLFRKDISLVDVDTLLMTIYISLHY
jgi:hypothetical protein